MVAYQGEAATPEPKLHVWDGTQWLFITFQDFSTSSYLRDPPSRVILVGDENSLPTSLIEAASETSPLVMNVPAQDAASLINTFGRALRFSGAEWQWFAGRYNLVLQDLNADARSQSWYDQPYVKRPRTPVLLPAPAVQPATTVHAPGEDVPEAEIIHVPTPGTGGTGPDTPALGGPEAERVPGRSDAVVPRPFDQPWREEAVATEPPLK
jgi:hypothetical protein